MTSNSVGTEDTSEDLDPDLHGPHYKCVVAGSPSKAPPIGESATTYIQGGIARGDAVTTGARCGARKSDGTESITTRSDGTNQEGTEVSVFRIKKSGAWSDFCIEVENTLSKPTRYSLVETPPSPVQWKPLNWSHHPEPVGVANMSLIDLDITAEEEKVLQRPLRDTTSEDQETLHSRHTNVQPRGTGILKVVKTEQSSKCADDTQRSLWQGKYFADPTIEESLVSRPPVKAKRELMPPLEMEVLQLRQTTAELKQHLDDLLRENRTQGSGIQKRLDNESSDSDQSTDLFEDYPQKRDSPPRRTFSKRTSAKTPQFNSSTPTTSDTEHIESTTGQVPRRNRHKKSYISSQVPVTNSKNRLRSSCSKEDQSKKYRDSGKRNRRDYIKLERFDGTTPLETFMVHFETCSEYNEWNNHEQLSQLKAALRGAAAQVLLSDDGPLTLEQLYQDLKENFGTKGLEAQFEGQLRTRRRQKGESLRTVYQDIHRLILQAYPDSKGKLRDKLALEAFIDSLNDSDLALKVRNLCPTDLPAAYRIALMLESNQMIVSRLEENKEKRKEGRSDVQARSVAESKEEVLQERIRLLEKKIKQQDLGMTTGPEGESPSHLHELREKLALLENSIRDIQSKLQHGRVKVRKQEEDWNGHGREYPQGNHSRNSSSQEQPCNEHYEQRQSCHYCKKEGHYKKDCPALERRRNDGQPFVKKNQFSAMKLACGLQGEQRSNQVYLDMKLDGINRSFLLDSGCDMTLLPAQFVQEYPLRETSKVVHAANGATIKLLGEVDISLRLGNLLIPTTALVSEFVVEAMIGYDWLASNDCYWGFKTGQVMIKDQVFPLRERNSRLGCCRVLVQQAVTIPKQSEAIILTKAVFDKVQHKYSLEPIEYATAPRELQNGLYVARAIIPHQCEDIPVRILNSSSKECVLSQGQCLSELEPVTVMDVIDEEGSTLQNDQWKKDLLKDVDPAVKADEIQQLDNLLDEYADCFSRSEFDLGRPTLVNHQIEPHNHPPVRPALR